jgi:hypothetical protein
VPAHDYCRDGGRLDAAGWVLDALAPSEAGRFALHLLTCPECQLTVAELEPVGQLLATSPASRPPARLAAATLGRVRQAARRPWPSGLTGPPGPPHS